MSSFFYCGIGSRSTPAHIQSQMTKIATWLAKRGGCLRSGHAQGADMAFEIGCDLAQGVKQIFVPWAGFNKCVNGIVPELDFAKAALFHPAWHNCSAAARKLLARDLVQVTGTQGQAHCLFVVCYTPNGDGSGGTGMAIRYAKSLNIPVFDLGCLSAHEVCVKINSIIAC